MSSYLTIKKNGVDLISWCRSSEQYQALKGKAPYGDFKEFEANDIDEGIMSLELSVKEFKEQIEDRKKLLTTLRYEDALECLSDLEEMKNELKWKEYALTNLYFLKDICEESVYEQDGENEVEVPIKLEWRYD